MQHPFNPDPAHTIRDPAIEFFHKLQAAPASRYFNVTNAIIALNIVSFLVIALLGGGWVFGGRLGIDLSGVNTLIFAKYGANNGSVTTNGEWWRLITSMFMHYTIGHLLLNMVVLYCIGPFFEKLQGRAVYLLTYLACGIAGGFASIYWNGDTAWSAGASGAIFGIFGVMIGCMLRYKNALPPLIRNRFIIFAPIFTVPNICVGIILPNVDYSAHIGGLICGIILGLLLAPSLEPNARARQKRRRWR